jgi:hypothetical protein
MKERLSHIKNKLSGRQISVYYAWYSPKAVYMYDTEDALEDFLWMIAEIEKLRIENNDLQSPRYNELKKKLLQKSLAENAKAIKNLKRQRSRKTRT